jgi:hypothetical protein
MKQFFLGLIVGTILMGSWALAGSIYDPSGQSASPRGSMQQQEFFRNRQQQLDIGAMRNQLDRERAERKLGIPCP